MLWMAYVLLGARRHGCCVLQGGCAFIKINWSQNREGSGIVSWKEELLTWSQARRKVFVSRGKKGRALSGGSKHGRGGVCSAGEWVAWRAMGEESQNVGLSRTILLVQVTYPRVCYFHRSNCGLFRLYRKN